MRNLDELLQDIPLDELMGTAGRDPFRVSEEDKGEETERPREEIKLKSKLPAVTATAAAIFLIAAAALFVTVMKGRLDPRKDPSENEAAPIETYSQAEPSDDPLSSLADESLAPFEFVGTSYKTRLLQSAMEQFSQSVSILAGSPIKQGELYLPLEDTPTEQVTLVRGLELATRRKLYGYAFFLFDENGKVLFTEWTEKRGAPVYCSTGAKLRFLGEYPESYTSYCKKEYSDSTELPFRLVRISEADKELILNKAEAGALLTELALIKTEGAEEASVRPLERAKTIQIAFADAGTGFMTVSIWPDAPYIIEMNGQIIKYNSQRIIDICLGLF